MPAPRDAHRDRAARDRGVEPGRVSARRPSWRAARPRVRPSRSRPARRRPASRPGRAARARRRRAGTCRPAAPATRIRTPRARRREREPHLVLAQQPPARVAVLADASAACARRRRIAWATGNPAPRRVSSTGPAESAPAVVRGRGGRQVAPRPVAAAHLGRDDAEVVAQVGVAALRAHRRPDALRPDDRERALIRAAGASPAATTAVPPAARQSRRASRAAHSTAIAVRFWYDGNVKYGSTATGGSRPAVAQERQRHQLPAAGQVARAQARDGRVDDPARLAPRQQARAAGAGGGGRGEPERPRLLLRAAPVREVAVGRHRDLEPAQHLPRGAPRGLRAGAPRQQRERAHVVRRGERLVGGRIARRIRERDEAPAGADRAVVARRGRHAAVEQAPHPLAGVAPVREHRCPARRPARRCAAARAPRPPRPAPCCRGSARCAPAARSGRRRATRATRAARPPPRDRAA